MAARRGTTRDGRMSQWRARCTHAVATVTAVLLVAACGGNERAATGTSPDGGDEVCNFVDDNGNGFVDEGFGWVMSPSRVVMTTDRYAGVSRAFQLEDGSIVLSGEDQWGEPGDRQFVVRIDQSGAILSGPTYVDVPLSNVGGAGFASLGADRVAIAFGSTDWAGCKQGCPVTFAVFALPDLRLELEQQIELPFASGDRCSTLACDPDRCVTVVSDNASPPALHAVWLDPSGVVTHVKPAAVEGAVNAFLASSDGRLAWAATVPTPDGTARKVMAGIYAMNQGSEIVAPTELARDQTVQVDSETSVMWAGGNLLVAYGAPTGLHVAIARSDGGVEAPVTLSTTNVSYPVLLGVAGATVVAGVRPFGMDLFQLGAGFEPDPVAPRFSADVDFKSGALARAQGGLVLVRGTYDGRTIESTTIHCP